MIKVNITTEHFDIFRRCRKLLKEGMDPLEEVVFYRDSKPVFICNTLEGGAKWRVEENNKVSPRFMKYIKKDEFWKEQ